MNSDFIQTFGFHDASVEYRLRPGGYAIVIRDDGCVAVVLTPSGPMLPGGGQEADESPEVAVVREVIEECGLRIELKRRIGVADELAVAADEIKHYRKRCTFFTAEVVERVGDGEADHELVWMPMGEAVASLMHGSQRWAVKRAFDEQDGAVGEA